MKQRSSKTIIKNLQKFPELSKATIEKITKEAIKKCTEENGPIPPGQLRMVATLSPIAYLAVITNGGKIDQAENLVADIATELPRITNRLLEVFNKTTQKTAKNLIALVTEISDTIALSISSALSDFSKDTAEKITSVITTSIRFLSFTNVKDKDNFEIKWLDLKSDLSGGWEWSDLKKYAPLALGAVALGTAAYFGAPLIASSIATTGLPFIYNKIQSNAAMEQQQNISDQQTISGILQNTPGVGVDPIQALNAQKSFQTSVQPAPSIIYGIPPPQKPPQSSVQVTPLSSIIQKPPAPKFHLGSNSSDITPKVYYGPEPKPIQNTVTLKPVSIPQTQSQPSTNFMQYITNTGQNIYNGISNGLSNIYSYLMPKDYPQITSLPQGYENRVTDSELTPLKQLKVLGYDNWRKAVTEYGNTITNDEVVARYDIDNFNKLKKDFPELANVQIKNGEINHLSKPLDDVTKTKLMDLGEEGWKYYIKRRGNDITPEEIALYKNNENAWFHSGGRRAASEIIERLPPTEFEYNPLRTNIKVDNTKVDNTKVDSSSSSFYMDHEGKINPLPNKDNHIPENIGDTLRMETKNILNQVKAERENLEKSGNVVDTSKPPDTTDLNKVLVGNKDPINGDTNIDMSKQKSVYEKKDTPSKNNEVGIEAQQEINKEQTTPASATNKKFNAYDVTWKRDKDGNVIREVKPVNAAPDEVGRVTYDEDKNMHYIQNAKLSFEEAAEFAKDQLNNQPIVPEWSNWNYITTPLSTIAKIIGFPIPTALWLIKSVNAYDPVCGQLLAMGAAPFTPQIIGLVGKLYKGIFGLINSGLDQFPDNKFAKGVRQFNSSVGEYVEKFVDTFSDDDVKALGNIISQTIPALVQDYTIMKQRTAVYNQQVAEHKARQRDAEMRARAKTQENQRRIDIENKNIDIENEKAKSKRKEEIERAQLTNENAIRAYEDDANEYNNLIDYSNASDIIKMKNAKLLHDWEKKMDEVKFSKNKYDALTDSIESGLSVIGNVIDGITGLSSVSGAIDKGIGLIGKQSAIDNMISKTKLELKTSNDLANEALSYLNKAKNSIDDNDKKDYYDRAFSLASKSREYFNDAMNANDRAIASRQEEIGKKYGLVTEGIHNFMNIFHKANDYNYWSQMESKPLEYMISSKLPPKPKRPTIGYVPNELTPGELKQHLPDAENVIPEYVGPIPALPLDMYSMPGMQHVIRNVIPGEFKKIEEKRKRDEDILNYLKSLANQPKAPQSLIVNPGPHTKTLQTTIQPVKLVKAQPLHVYKPSPFKTPKIPRTLVQPPTKKRR